MKLVEEKQLKNRVAGVFGSYGWSGGSIDRMKKTINKLDWDLTEPVIEFNGMPEEEDLEKGRELGRKVADKVC